jgi:hypothetical protein
LVGDHARKIRGTPSEAVSSSGTGPCHNNIYEDAGRTAGDAVAWYFELLSLTGVISCARMAVLGHDTPWVTEALCESTTRTVTNGLSGSERTLAKNRVFASPSYFSLIGARRRGRRGHNARLNGNRCTPRIERHRGTAGCRRQISISAKTTSRRNLQGPGRLG